MSATPITIERQIACVRREISMRRHVYPGWVERGKMTQGQADEQIACMEAVRATLEQLRTAEREHREPGLFP